VSILQEHQQATHQGNSVNYDDKLNLAGSAECDFSLPDAAKQFDSRSKCQANPTTTF
jgi:hypothetical protein